MSSDRHYPLNGLDLSFHRYHHRRLDVTDVIACRLMEAWLFPICDPITPGKVHPTAFRRPLLLHHSLIWESLPGHFNHPDSHPKTPPPETGGQDHGAFLRDLVLFILLQSTHCGGFPCLNGRDPSRSLRSVDGQVIAVLRRYSFETSHPEIRPWLSWQPKGYQPPSHRDLHVSGCCPKHHYALDTARPRNCAEDTFFARSTQRTWMGDDLYRLRWHYRRPAPLHSDGLLSQGTILQDAHQALGAHLWSPGPVGLPPPILEVTSGVHTGLGPYKVPEAHLPIEPGSWRHRCRVMTRPFYAYSTTLRTRRSRSEPPPGAYMLTAVPDAYSRQVGTDKGSHSTWNIYSQPSPEDYLRQRYALEDVLIPLYVPCPRISEVDHRTRRRSLSRRHVARMFHLPSREGGCLLDKSERERLGERPRKLGRRCGWCGSAQHRDDKCPVSKKNRCKCRPWPIYHTAKGCPIECSRFCVDAETRRWKGHDWPAMMCKARCCMCGLRGHSGRECQQRRCRCGGIHLGQDCGWKPACVVEGCDRYLCPLHCRECGSGEKPFVGRRCGPCLENEVPAGEAAHQRGESKRKKYWDRSRKREREEREQAGGGLTGDDGTGRGRQDELDGFGEERGRKM